MPYRRALVLAVLLALAPGLPNGAQAGEPTDQFRSEIDHLYRKIFADVIDLMRTDPRTVERGTRLILAAHWVERIGDRVTNIAEDVVYLATGRIEDLNP